jgi:hypothetical protein
LFAEVLSVIVEVELGPMKRKIHAKAEPVVPADLLEQAKKSVSPDRLRKAEKCSVCGAETTVPAAGESLCWVCRRLKISAWREIEQQMPMQE